MSVPGLSPAGLDLATLLRLSGHGPLAAGSAAEIASAAAIRPAMVENVALQEAIAQVDLSLLGPGEAPSDASIGLYTAALGDPGEVATLAANAEAIQLNLVAARIDQILVEALSLSLRTAPAQEVLDLMQAVEAAALAAGLSESAQAAASPAQEAAPGGQAGMLANLQGLVAAAQTGDMTGAEALARAIGTQVQATLPGETPPPALMQLLAPATGFPMGGAEVNPMLMAMQMSLMLSAKSTLARLRKLREDRLKLLAIAPFAPLEEDKTRESE